MEYILNLNAFLAHIIMSHPKHKDVEKRLLGATKVIIPDLMIVELQWIVLSERYPEINEEMFIKVLNTIKADPSVQLERVTPEIVIQQKKWYKRLSFFDAYYAAFSIVHKRKLLTTDPDFEGLNFAEVV